MKIILVVTLLAFYSVTVQATPNETSLGSQSYRTFNGDFQNLGSSVFSLFTVPSGQDFIVNTALCNGVRLMAPSQYLKS